MFENLKREWREFREAEPGERFKAYHKRVKQASTGSRVLRIALGLVLVAVGIVMLFVPGPGILFVVFGLACFGGESKWIASGLDAAELKARAAWHWAKAKWRDMPTWGRVLGVVLALLVVGAVGVGMWQLIA